MKKILRCAALTVALIGAGMALSWGGEMPGVQAYYEYNQSPRYLYDNSDYVAAYGQRDDIYFVDLSSVVITKQEKQFYTIAANVVQYRPARDEVLNTYTRYILFDTKKGYIYPIYQGKIDKTRPIYTHAHTAEYGLRDLAVARLMWHKATGGYWNY